MQKSPVIYGIGNPLPSCFQRRSGMQPFLSKLDRAMVETGFMASPWFTGQAWISFAKKGLNR